MSIRAIYKDGVFKPCRSTWPVNVHWVHRKARGVLAGQLIQ